MAKNEAKRQKRAAKHAAKRAEKRKQLAARTSVDPTIRLRGVEDWEVIDSEVDDSLDDEGIGITMISRRAHNGEIAWASYLVDRWCLGVKNAFWRIGSLPEYEMFLQDLRPRSNLKPRPPEYLAKLVRDAVEYARVLDISPHRDYKQARLLLAGIDPDLCNVKFEFGQNGVPVYVRGPEESRADFEILARRIEAAGGKCVYQEG